MTEMILTDDPTVIVAYVRDETSVLLSILSPLRHGSGTRGSTGILDTDRLEDGTVVDVLTGTGQRLLRVAAEQATEAWARLDHLYSEGPELEDGPRRLLSDAVDLLAVLGKAMQLPDKGPPAEDAARGAYRVLELLDARAAELEGKRRGVAHV